MLCYVEEKNWNLLQLEIIQTICVVSGERAWVKQVGQPKVKYLTFEKTFSSLLLAKLVVLSFKATILTYVLSDHFKKCKKNIFFCS